MKGTVLKIVQAGDPVLRRRARELTPEEISSPEVKALIERMRDTMRDTPGVGLAAPQVGVGLRLVVVEDRAEYQAGLSAEELATRERKPVAFHVLINPRLVVEDPTPVEFYEGCLSASGYAALVRRARGVRVEALDENGSARHPLGSGLVRAHPPARGGSPGGHALPGPDGDAQLHHGREPPPPLDRAHHGPGPRGARPDGPEGVGPCACRY